MDALVAETLPQAWARCRGHIEAALEYAGGTHLIEDVEAAIEAGEAHFWPAKHSAIVTQFLDYPRGRFCSFWLAGGDLEELLGMTKPIEIWARQNGCKKIFECGRLGWGRPLRGRGYRALYTVMAKELV